MNKYFPKHAWRKFEKSKGIMEPNDNTMETFDYESGDDGVQDAAIAEYNLTPGGRSCR